MASLENTLQHYFEIDTSKSKKIASFFKQETILKGDFFLKSLQYSDRLSFVEKGYLRMFTQHNNKEITQWISGSGYAVVDLSSFLFGERSRWNIQALQDSTVFSIYKSDYKILNSILIDWQEIENKFLSKCFVAIENRVFGHLSMSAEERYNQFYEANKEMFNQIPLQYIASMLGMSPETLSRIRGK